MIIRQSPTETRILAKGITALTISQPSSCSIQVELTAGKEKPLQLKEKVALRAKTNFFKPTRGRYAETQ